MNTSTALPRRRRKTRVDYSSNEVRQFILEFLYDRNRNATSARSDKTGAAVKISAMRRELKESYGLTQSEVRSNLTYLLSQGWAEEQTIVKSVTTPRGGMIPASTSYYIVTAAGIDKIEGPGEFTMDKFHGIRIEATGQNIITVGDGNQVNAEHADSAQALADLKDELCRVETIDERTKVDVVGDIDSIQSQLAKPQPNRSVIQALWKGIEHVSKLADIAEKVAKAGSQLGPFLLE